MISKVFDEENEDEEDEETGEEFILVGGLDSIIYLTGAVVIGYWCKSKYDAVGVHYHFKSFLWIAFFFVFVRALVIAIGAVVIHRDESRRRNNSGSNNS